MNSHNFKALSVGLVIMLITACAKYKPTTLELPRSKGQEKNGLVVQAESLSNDHAKNLFGGRSPHKKGYKAIQIAIQNNTSATYTLSAQNIGLEIVPTSVVAEQLEFNTAGRVIGWAIGGLFLWPLFIPAIVEGTNASKANKAIRNDFNTRVISSDSNIIIEPGKTLNRVMFVHADNYKTTFNISLVNQSNHNSQKFIINL